MNVIVTNNEVQYRSFLKVSTTLEATQIVGTIDILIYNNSDEDESEKISNIGILKDKATKLIYICNSDSTNTAIKMMFIGSNGKYFDDEFFLESEQELVNLTNSLDEVTALAELGGVNVLSDFLNRYLNNGSSDFKSGYLRVVKNAVSELMSEYNQKNLEILQMSETATDIFSNTSMILSNMKTEQDNMQKIVDKLKKSVVDNNPHIPKVVGGGSSVLFFPRVNYLKERSIIRVKELGGCRFLVSFSLGFRIYMESVKHIRTKLIICMPVGDNYENMYEDFTWVTPGTKNSGSVYYDSVVFTNCPNKEVMYTLLDDSNFDVFIVIDKTVSDKEHILNCKGSKVKYAVNGMSCIKRFNVNTQECFSSILDIGDTMFTIPLFPEYPVNNSMRERTYLSEVSDSYELLIKDLRKRGV